MDRLLVDTNIVIDLLAKREGFYSEAQELFTLADEKIISLYISALTLANTHYILSKYLDVDEVRKILIKFKTIVEVLPLEDKVLELALASDFNDFEDAIQYYTATDNGLEIIVIRNKKDFRKSKLPVLTAREYLNR